MKQCIWLLSLLVIANVSYCQVVAIQKTLDNELYVCVQNPLNVAVEKCASKKIRLITNNGRVQGEKGHWVICPEHTGNTVIYVYKKTVLGLKFIDSQYFRAKQIPLSKATINGRPDGKITKSLFCSQIAPVAVVYCCGFDFRFKIVSFTVVVYRSCDKEIFRRTMSDSNGTRIDSVTHEFFTTLENNDKVVFTDIKMVFCYDAPRVGEPIELSITDAEYYKRPSPGENETVIDPINGNEYVRPKW